MDLFNPKLEHSCLHPENVNWVLVSGSRKYQDWGQEFPMFCLFLFWFRSLNEPLPLPVPLPLPSQPLFCFNISNEIWGGEGGMVSYSPKNWAWIYWATVGAAADSRSWHSQCCMDIPCWMEWKFPGYPVCLALQSHSAIIPSHFSWQLRSHTVNQISTNFMSSLYVSHAPC